MKKVFLFDFPIKLFIESYLNIGLSSMINLMIQLTPTGSYGEILSTFLSLFLFVNYIDGF